MERNVDVLLERYRQGSISDAELSYLLGLVQVLGEERAVEVSEAELLLLRSELMDGLGLAPAVPKRSLLWRRVAAVAAVLVVLFGVGLWIYRYRLSSGNEAAIAVASKIMPGREGATLRLASGRVVRLDDLGTGEVAVEAGVRISKDASGQLTYELLGGEGARGMNELSTTRGQVSSVRLPDGSMVWLNAASVLRYPAGLVAGGKRRVELSGEAYFEVAKDAAVPFVVSADGQSVEVLGTHFNVNGYGDGGRKVTTLLEGSVRISAGDRVSVLRPGEQSVVSASGMEVKAVPTGYAMAWRKGYMVFDNEALEEAMPRVARWYGIEYGFGDAEAAKVRFFGTVGRDKNLSEVLSMLERTGLVSFSMEGKKLLISSK